MSSPTISSEPTARVGDGRLDAAPGATISTAKETNTSLVLCKARDSKVPDSVPDSEYSAPLSIEPDRAPIMEFTAADVFQHSPFGDILNLLKSLSLSKEPRPDYGRGGWDADDEVRTPPTTHLIATVDDLTDMLNFDSEDIDGMDADKGDDQEPAPIGLRKTTSSYDVCMVDTYNRNNNEDQKDAARDRSPEKQSKRQRKRKAKPHLDKDPAIE